MGRAADRHGHGLAIPPDSGWDGSAEAGKWQASSITVPAGYVYIEVGGDGVYHQANPDCHQAGSPCSYPLDGLTTGPLYQSASSRIRVSSRAPDAPPR